MSEDGTSPVRDCGHQESASSDHDTSARKLQDIPSSDSPLLSDGDQIARSPADSDHLEGPSNTGTSRKRKRISSSDSSLLSDGDQIARSPADSGDSDTGTSHGRKRISSHDSHGSSDGDRIEQSVVTGGGHKTYYHSLNLNNGSSSESLVWSDGDQHSKQGKCRPSRFSDSDLNSIPSVVGELVHVQEQLPDGGACAAQSPLQVDPQSSPLPRTSPTLDRASSPGLPPSSPATSGTPDPMGQTPSPSPPPSTPSSPDPPDSPPQNNNLYDGCPHTKDDVCKSIAGYLHTTNTTATGHALLLKLLDKILPDDHKLPGSVYLFRKGISEIYEGYEVETDNVTGNQLITFDVASQLQVILKENEEEMLEEYQMLDNRAAAGTLSEQTGTLYSEKFVTIRNGNRLPVSLMLYIDSAPAYRKKNFSIHFILGSILELPLRSRLSDYNTVLFGMWAGTGKPNLEQFLDPLITSTQNNQYFDLDLQGNSYNMQLWVHSVLADLIGKAYILNQKQFNGKFGCSKCLHPGRNLDPNNPGTRIYRYCRHLILRTSAQVAQHLATLAARPNLRSYYGIKGPTPISRIVSIPDQIPIDPMHCIFERVFKRLLALMCSPSHRNEPFSIRRHMGDINRLISQIKTVHELHRNAQSISAELKGLKASEYRSLLLCLIPVFKGYLPNEYFDNFIRLSVAVRMLMETPITDEKTECARSLLTKFVREVERLYDLDQCTYSVHALLHLPDQVKLLGTLAVVSAFLFESAIGVIKRHFHGSRNVGGQVAEQLVIQSNLRQYAREKERINEPTLMHTISAKITRKRHRTLDILPCKAILPSKEIEIDNELQLLLQDHHTLIGLTQNELNNLQKIIKFERIVLRREMIHSMSYSRRGNSCSYMVEYSQNGDKFFASIEYFILLNNSIFAVINNFQILRHFSLAPTIVNASNVFTAVQSLNHRKAIIPCSNIAGRVTFVPTKIQGTVIGYVSRVLELEHD